MARTKGILLLSQILVVALFVLNYQAKAGKDAVRIVITGTAKPFSYVDGTGALVGFNVELMNAVCQFNSWVCSYEVARFPEVLPALEQNRADIGVGNFLYTPARAARALYSEPYWRSTTSFVGLKTANDAPDALKCAIHKTQQAAFLERQEMQRRYYPDNDALIQALLAGECSYILLPTLQVLEFLQSEAGLAYGFYGTPLFDDGLGGDVHILVNAQQSARLEALNLALSELHRQGVYERIMLKYFPFSIR